MSMMDRPMIVITFQGVIGDFIKPQLFAQYDKNDLYCSTRVGMINGLKFLSQYFQLVILNNPMPEEKCSVKEMSEKIK